MGVYSEMAADLRDNVQDRSPAIQDAAELASKRADDRQQAEEEQAKALLSQMQQNTDDSPSPSNLKADKKAEEDRKRQEHEQAEAKRKAEWEARQRAKEEAEQAAWENAVAMSDDEVMAASMKRVGDDSERLTRRNMKQCVTEYIQTLCLEDVAFARNVMHPRKNMVPKPPQTLWSGSVWTHWIFWNTSRSGCWRSGALRKINWRTSKLLMQKTVCSKEL